MTSSLVGSEMCIRDRFINEPLIKGCNKRGVCMTQTPPYQPRSNRLIERMVGIVKDHMREVLHAAVEVLSLIHISEPTRLDVI
eukprot:8577766-Prorocentrum_lima.AAC.1